MYRFFDTTLCTDYNTEYLFTLYVYVLYSYLIHTFSQLVNRISTCEISTKIRKVFSAFGSMTVSLGIIKKSDDFVNELSASRDWINLNFNIWNQFQYLFSSKIFTQMLFWMEKFESYFFSLLKMSLINIYQHRPNIYLHKLFFF